MPPDKSRRFLRVGKKFFSRSRSSSPDPLDPAKPVPDPRQTSRSTSLPFPNTNASSTTTGIGSTSHTSATSHSNPVPSAHPIQQNTNPGSGGPLPAVAPGPTIHATSAIPVQIPVLVVSSSPNPADDVFREALDHHKQGLTPAQRKAFHVGSAVQLMDIVQDLDQQHNNRSLTRKSAMKVQGFLEVVDGYLKVLGIFIQHSPEYSSLVVGGLKLFVDIGRRYGGFFEKLSETMQVITGHLDYLSRYARLYSQYVEALCDAYGDLISFCTAASSIFMNEEGKLSSKISGKVLFKQLSSPLESSFDAINTRFTEHVIRVEKTANIMESERKLLKESLEAREKADAERGKLLSWLSKLEPEDDLERIYDKRHPNTGLWLTESDDLKRWFDATKHCLLWCYGSAGVGKSVLTSILIEEVASKYPFDDHIGIAFYYFSFQNETIQTRDILAILIKQLCRRMKDLPLSIQTLYKKCLSNDKAPRLLELQGQFKAIIETFEEVYLVMDALDEYKMENRKQFLVYLVELLDKCSGRLKIFVTSRPEVDIKRAFTSNQFQTIQIEATKVEADISSYVHHELLHRPQDYCEMDQELLGEIQTALISQSSGMFLWVKCQLDYLYQQPSKQDVKDALKSLPQDMTTTYRRILDRIYNQSEAMKVIAQRALMWVITAKRPLDPAELALVVSIDPRSDSGYDMSKKYQSQVVIEACCGLLTVESGLVRPIHFTVKEFLQGSGTGIPSEEEANAELVRSSIQYMLSEDPEDFGMLQGLSNISSNHAEYIFSFWDHHVRDLPLPLPTEFTRLLRRFLNSNMIYLAYNYRNTSTSSGATVIGLCAIVDLIPIYNQLFTLDNFALNPVVLKQALRDAASTDSITSIKVLLGMGADAKDSELVYLAARCGSEEALQIFLDHGAHIHTSDGPPALQAASANGHVSMVQFLLSKGVDINIQGGKYGTALQTASDGGNTAVVNFLLSKGANVNIQGGFYGTALQAACCRGHTAIIECLLSRGADVNIQGGFYGTPLEAACHGGNTAIVECLLSKGADVNIQGGKYGTALQAACSGGHTGVVECLLSKGADVNIQGGFYGTALQAACHGGHTEIVECLLPKGADVDVQGGEYGTALQAACSGGYMAIVECLLSKGADVNIQSGLYGTALQAACHGGHTEIVDCLLCRGADVNIQGGFYDTALQAACYGGYTSIVECLLSRDADVNIHGEQYGTALQAACCGGHTAIVDCLLSRGADVNIQGGFFGNALQAACYGGHREIVDCLLCRGADVNIQGGFYGTALQAACCGGYTSIVEFLLSKGADVNIQSGWYGTALQAACNGGHTAVVEILLSKGADVNTQGGEYGTALQAASYEDHTEIVEFLLSKGADVDIQGGEYCTALQAACTRGHTAIIECLLSRGADVNIQGGSCGTALQAACHGGHTAIVECLLSRGADVNIQGGFYGTALLAACCGGYTSIVECLLSRGADVNIQSGEYGTALEAASRKDHRPIVKLLLLRGAGVNIPGGEYGTAL